MPDMAVFYPRSVEFYPRSSTHKPTQPVLAVPVAALQDHALVKWLYSYCL